MEPSSTSQPPRNSDGGQLSEFDSMETQHPPPLTVDDHSVSTSLWDWNDLLDFTIDDGDHFPLHFDAASSPLPPPTESPQPPLPTTEEALDSQVPTSDRIRKRDPRMTCSNFIAGRVPCACPEIDEKLEEEEAAMMPGKKRVRVTRSSNITARCQVPGCEADISELKGYHKRHRVCLRCANASSVVLDGENKRYCQQCGKFHVLLDFDEGKRSCRRKLEKHNNRRRRKATVDSQGMVVETEAQGDLLLDQQDTACDGEAGKDVQIVEKEALVDSEPNSGNVNSDSGASFGGLVETQIGGGKDDAKFGLSPSYCDNKTSYSSVCPTGRISFKLYDWNPAEFPRRLRHQIFQWLASMPIELEGYIRPGCTILTAFIAMPTFMWGKLYEDPLSYVHHLVVAPGKMLSRRGPMFVYLNNMIFYVKKDGTSVVKISADGCAPRLHYVHPMCFEAGKPIEFVACGSNLLQPKFRFLVSFAGKYLVCDYRVASPHGHTAGGSSLDHQLYKIFIPHIEPNLFGPAFIEVENEGGLSNFIPVLIGDRDICFEMRTIQQRFDVSHLSNGSECEVSSLRQMTFSEFVVDIAWLLKEPSSENFEQIMTTSQIRRVSSLLNFLLHHESTTILSKILHNLKIMVDKMDVNSVVNGTSDADMRLLRKYMDYAGDLLLQKLEKSEGVEFHAEYMQERDCVSGTCFKNGMPLVASFSGEYLESRSDEKLGVMASLTPIVRSERDPLLDGEFVMKVNLVTEKPSKSCGHFFSSRVMKTRPSIFVIAVVVCFGVCAVLLHPHQVSRFAVSMRRCLINGF